MIEEITIKNFRGLASLDAKFCRRVNVIVGDNGVGKTALLEAIYLTLGSSPALAWKLKQMRGFEGSFQGSAAQINEAIVGDYFYNFDLDSAISVILKGTSDDTRSLTIGRGVSGGTLPLDGKLPPVAMSIPIEFTWGDHHGVPHTAAIRVGLGGQVQIEDTGERRPDFFGFFSTQPILANEIAGRFSQLSRANRHHDFVRIIAAEYPWVDDLNIEVLAGAPILYATLKGSQKVPINSVGGAITRIVGILLAVCVRENGVVLVDEIENGVYYKHQTAVWKALLALSREYQTQLFVTSHSAEALRALHEAANGENLNDIAFWRLERTGDQSIGLRQFSGQDFAAAIEYNNEVR